MSHSASDAVVASLRLAIRGYQWTLRPMLGQRCRFWPSCSDYMSEALTTHGPLMGLWLGSKRLGKCHPWHAGGVDPVPPVAQAKNVYPLESPDKATI